MYTPLPAPTPLNTLYWELTREESDAKYKKMEEQMGKQPGAKCVSSPKPLLPRRPGTGFLL
jgi:hypothetical protein